MTIDVTTLLLATLINALLMSLALGICIGFRTPGGLRRWNLSLLLQAAGWAGLIAAALVAPRLPATIGVALLSASTSLLHYTCWHYTGRHRHGGWLALPPMLLGGLHWLVFDSPVLAVSVTNVVIGVQLLLVALSLRPRMGLGRWSWLIATTAAGNGLLMLARTYLILCHTELYPRFSQPHPLNIAHLLLLNGSMVMGTIGFLLAHRDEAEQALNRLASFDSLTGLLNRRVWLQECTARLNGTAPGNAPLLLMFDLDHFKQVNDSHGHLAGDRVLEIVGEVLRDAVRSEDLAGRYGGEEFCLLLHHCHPADFVDFDQRLHRQLKARTLAELGFAVDYSGGAIALAPGMSLTSAIQQADRALYQAKRQGRGQTCMA